MSEARQQDLAADLLFGVLALQLGLVRAEQVVEAGAAWAADRSRAPGQRLREEIQAAGKDCGLVERMLAAAVDSQGGDAIRTLHSFGGEQVVLRSFGGSVAWDGADLEPTWPGRLEEQGAAELDLVSLQVSDEQPGRYRYRNPDTHQEVDDLDAATVGRGGIGRILLAYDLHLGRELAMKELLPAGARGRKTQSPKNTFAALGRFLREARITGQLEHPNIVPVYELGRRADHSLYYTMKVVRGRTLADALKACQGLSDRLGLLNHFADVCLAAAFAHSRGVVHRDIKPENVMLGAFGETVLVDWGLAKAVGSKADGADLDQAPTISDEVEVDAGETLVGTAVGTPAYMSPEQAEGRIEDIDARSDIWSLGAVLYELLTGRRPFEGKHPFEVIGKVISQDCRPAQEICPAAPPELCILADKALSRKPADRFQDAKELAEEVGRFLSGGQVALYAYSPWEQLKRRAVEHKVVLSATVAVLLLLLVLAVSLTARLLSQREQALVAEQATRQQRVAAQQEETRATWQLLSGGAEPVRNSE